MSKPLLKLRNATPKPAKQPYSKVDFDPMETIDPTDAQDLLVPVVEMESGADFDTNIVRMPDEMIKEAREAAHFNTI